MPPQREMFSPFVDLSPGVAGPEACEGPSANLLDKKTITQKHLARNSLGIQQSSESKELGNVYLLPHLGRPADGLAEVKSDMAPLLRLPESGAFYPGIPRPPQDNSSTEGGGELYPFSLVCDTYICLIVLLY